MCIGLNTNISINNFIYSNALRIYFQIPTDLFLPNYQTGNISFGLHPLTKDGGALLYNHNALWGLLGNADRTGLLRDWSDIID